MAPTLRVHLHGGMLRNARAGTFPAMAVLARAVEAQGWRVSFEPASPEAYQTAPPPGDYALLHMKQPLHPRTLTLRRAYHYPFWRIEQVAERWRFAVAQARFDPAEVDGNEAAGFVRRLRRRVLPGPEPRRGDHILVPLQGHIRRMRSFQTMSPVEMLDAVCRTGRPVMATLHPSERYDDADHAALAALARRHPDLSIGGDTMALLRDCAFVATQNSAVALDGMILGKPAVLFAQIDFHHAALNVAEMGAEAALAAAAEARPDLDRYLYWFLKLQAIDAQDPDAGARMLAAMRRGGWPI
ncbi:MULTISPECIES: hypothetical protein [unclassified Paracoccus (in: a-proteobacteria)]|nr:MULTISPECIES: hypothetical protein [unclassified Paracoccus (in: a-proteobacteria)]MBB1492570.1 hypothetical protein [Paracoccus sp. MC1854]MBB1498393.1 hypothetical protein [Paracoccus sp. MC1862]QQO44399.1 hypothetical protein JGR78_13715 [Paracoccus sp. MC1862]